MPYQPELDNIDIALIGVPFDLGVYNRAGARLGPKAIRNVAMFGSFNHHSKINPAALCPIADVGDVPIENRYHLDDGLRDIEKYFQQGGNTSVGYAVVVLIGRFNGLII